MSVLPIKKGDIVARIKPRHDGRREISLYFVETAGKQNTRVRDYGRVSMTMTQGRDFFTEDNAVVFTEEEADEYLAEMRSYLNAHPRNDAAYFGLVENTIKFAFHGAA